MSNTEYQKKVFIIYKNGTWIESDDRSAFEFQDDPDYLVTIPSPSPVQGVEEAAVKSAEEEAMRRFPIIAEEYFDDTWRTYDEYEKEQLKFRDLFVTASKWQASRSKGVGMAEVILREILEASNDVNHATRETPIDEYKAMIQRKNNAYNVAKLWLSESAPLSDNSQEEGREVFTREQMEVKELAKAFIYFRNTLMSALNDSLSGKEVKAASYEDIAREYLSASPGSEGKEENKCGDMNNDEVKVGAYVWQNGFVKRISNQNVGERHVVIDNLTKVRKSRVQLVKIGSKVIFHTLSDLPERCKDFGIMTITGFKENGIILTDKDSDGSGYGHFKSPNPYSAKK